MKKLTALLLLCSLLLLCACGKSDPAGSNTTAAPATPASDTAAETTTNPMLPSRKAADLSKLPEDFPPLPDGVVNLTVSHLSGGGKFSGYALDRTRITFDCYEPVFYQFTNSLIAAGYVGACRNMQTADYYQLGFAGGWQNGKHLIVIDKSEKTDGNTIRYTLDFENCSDCFPHVLGDLFPSFAAVSRSKGTYLGYSYQTNASSDVFESLAAYPCWQWQFRFDDAFLGVTEEAFRNYVSALEENGFSGNVTQNTYDGCLIYSADVVKSTEDGDYGLFMNYNTSLLTLEAVFTNDPGYFLGENWKTGN